jgi:tetratricopeptide (TPR) repeat protein
LWAETKRIKKELEEAQQAATAAFHLAPSSPVSLILLADVYYDKPNLREAMAYYEKAYYSLRGAAADVCHVWLILFLFAADKLFPHYLKLGTRLASLALHFGFHQKAKEIYTRISEESPSSSSFLGIH